MIAPATHDNRFVPESAQDFTRRAKHLAWITERPLQQSQENLARAYGYSGAHELRATIDSNRDVEVSEDVSESSWLATVGRRMQMEREFGDRLLHVLAGGETRADLAQLTHRDWLSRDIGFTEPWPEHKRQFARLKNSLLMEAAAEPDELRGAVPGDYGRAFVTSAGDYTIALTAAGQAVRDVLGRWYEEEEGPKAISMAAQRARIDALRARHPANPWLIADTVLSMGYTLGRAEDDSSAAWQDVLAEARHAIALFERIISTEQSAKYAGAKLISSGFGYGNEAYSYPSTLFYAGVAALNTERLREAVEYLERAYLTDTRDGAGARFALTEAYALRDKVEEPPAVWDELTFGTVLRAVTLFEVGDWKAGTDAYAYALIERVWQECNNGYEHAPRSLSGLLKAAAPVGTAHPDGWRTLVAIAKDSNVQQVVKRFTGHVSRRENFDLEADPHALARQIREAMVG